MERCSICLDTLPAAGVPALAWCGHRFHAACLARLADANGTPTMSTATRRVALTACPNCRKVSKVVLTPVAAAFGVGDRVLALWGHKWLPGVVDKVVDGGRAYEVAWNDDDGLCSAVLAAHIRARAPAPGRAAAAPECAPAAPEPLATALFDDNDNESDDSEDEMPVSELLARRAAASAQPAPPVRTATGNRDDGDEAPYEGDSVEETAEGVDSSDDDDDGWSPRAPARSSGGPADGSVRTTTSRFWGVCWINVKEKWTAYYIDADGEQHTIGYFDDEENAARARDKAVRDEKLEGKRRMNADATGALVPKSGHHNARDRSGVVAPDNAPSATTSRFWGVSWSKKGRQWLAQYRDANKKLRTIGYFDDQESAAHAVNARIWALPPKVQLRRRTNPVVDGRLVPRERMAPGHAEDYTVKKRYRDERAATPSTRARR